MTNLIAALAYAGFVTLGLITIIAGNRGDAAARRWASRLIGYVLVVSLTAGVTQRDLWPFSYWRLMQRVAPTEVSDTGYALIRPVAVTSAGTEYPVDYRAWEPFTHEELLTWLMRDFRSVSGPARDTVGAFLLRNAETARVAVRAGRWPGVVTRRLGNFAAPSHLLFARAWRHPDDVPASPFVAVHLYWEHWNIEERVRDPQAIRLTMLYEYPQHP